MFKQIINQGRGPPDSSKIAPTLAKNNQTSKSNQGYPFHNSPRIIILQPQKNK
jgi:hypothetical protein